MQLTEKQTEFMDAEGYLLVTGGPGSGKTTVSILKGAQIAECALQQGQRVLFLSFARATVSRVIQAIDHEQKIPSKQKKLIEVETYHSFFWRIIKAHGYLIGLPRRLSILTPPNEAIALSDIRNSYPPKSKITAVQARKKAAEETKELERLATDEGRVCFDLFAGYTASILNGSESIRKLVAERYPVIILDEFQDTNAGQWGVVEALGENSILHALADPEQRIYDWIGADPERLKHFEAAFSPTIVDLSDDNHRSSDKEIALFGNDILKGSFSKSNYSGVTCRKYNPNQNQAYAALLTTVYQARKRLIESQQTGWTLAILVPTKKLTRIVSDILRNPPSKRMVSVPHIAVVELEAAILGAEVISFLMQPDNDGSHFDTFVELLKNYFYGKGGDTPTKGDINEAEKIDKAYRDWLDKREQKKTIRSNSIFVAILKVYEQARNVEFSGDPNRDWISIRAVLGEGSCKRLKDLAQESRNLRLLDRGTVLRQDLAQDWRDNGCYSNALEITKQAFVRKHFSTSGRPETGVIVMNMHKAKGKQFDEVIIFEGFPRKVKGEIVSNPDRIVRGNLASNCDDQSRQNLRVSVTRAKSHTTILTPQNDPCRLFLK